MAELAEHLAGALKRAWPAGIVRVPVDLKEAWFWERHSGIKQDLAGLDGASIVHEREADGEQRCYHLFFLVPSDDRLRYETDTLEPDEDGWERRVKGKGFVGCAVGVSLLAPYAVVMLNEQEHYESGNSTEPDIEQHLFDLEGKALDLDEHYRELFLEEAYQLLADLRQRIAGVLKAHGIVVLHEEELWQVVPWLRDGKGVRSKPMTVKRALFVREVE